MTLRHLLLIALLLPGLILARGVSLNYCECAGQFVSLDVASDASCGCCADEAPQVAIAPVEDVGCGSCGNCSDDGSGPSDEDQEGGECGECCHSFEVPELGVQLNVSGLVDVELPPMVVWMPVQIHSVAIASHSWRRRHHGRAPPRLGMPAALLPGVPPMRV